MKNVYTYLCAICLACMGASVAYAEPYVHPSGMVEYGASEIVQGFVNNEYAMRALLKGKKTIVSGTIDAARDMSYYKTPNDVDSAIRTPAVSLYAESGGYRFDGHLFDDPIPLEELGTEKLAILMCTDIQKAMRVKIQGKCVVVVTGVVSEKGKLTIHYKNEAAFKEMRGRK